MSVYLILTMTTVVELPNPLVRLHSFFKPQIITRIPCMDRETKRDVGFCKAEHVRKASGVVVLFIYGVSLSAVQKSQVI